MNVTPFTPVNVNMSMATNPARTASSAGNLTPTDRAMPERWTIGKPYSPNYYYDEITTDELPPDQIDLSDYWVVKVVKAGIGAKERLKRWPAVFNSKTLKSAYQNKGAASKIQDVPTGKYYYETVFGTLEMHGTEGRAANYIRNINRKLTSKNTIGKGRECKKGSTMSGEKDPTNRNAPRLQNIQQKQSNQPKTEMGGSAKTAKAEVARVNPTRTAGADAAAIIDEYMGIPYTEVNVWDPTRNHGADAAAGDRSPLAKSDDTSLFDTSLFEGDPNVARPDLAPEKIGQQQGHTFGQPSYPTAGKKLSSGLLGKSTWTWPKDTPPAEQPKAVATKQPDPLIAETTKLSNQSDIEQTNLKSQDPPVKETAKSSTFAERAILADQNTPTDQDTLKRKREDNLDTPTNQDATTKKLKAATTTFAAKPMSLSSSSSDGDGDNVDTHAQLQGEVQRWKDRYHRLDTNWQQSYMEMSDDYTEVRSQLVELAKTAKEVHGTVGPLVDYGGEAAELMKSVYKALPADKRQTVKVFYRSSATRIDGMLGPANDAISRLAINQPEMHAVVYSDDMKSKEKLEEWMASLPKPQRPVFDRTPTPTAETDFSSMSGNEEHETEDVEKEGLDEQSEFLTAEKDPQ